MSYMTTGAGGGKTFNRGLTYYKTTTGKTGWFYYFGYPSDVSTQAQIGGIGRYRLSVCGALILNDGELISGRFTSTSDLLPLSFLRYYYGGNFYSADFIRLYRCAIVALDGTTTHDFLPCENPSGEEGLYDVVGRVFYGFSTT